MEDKIREEVLPIKTEDYKYDVDSTIKYLLNNYKDNMYYPHLIKERASIFYSLVNKYNLQDIINVIKEKLNIDIGKPLWLELRCCNVFLRYLLTNKSNKVVEELKCKNDFLERLYIRVCLLKTGWNEHSIEKFIKRLYKFNYTIENIEPKYFSIKKMLKIQFDEKTKGRPSLPEKIKDIVKYYRNYKNKEIMTEKYNISKDLNKLFTKDNILTLKSAIEDSNIDNKKELKDKLTILCKYT
jgi:hypothetical protein